MADLFGRDVKTIGKHINNALKEELMDESSVVANFATTASDGKTYKVDYYNLDVIISTGYRMLIIHIREEIKLLDYLEKSGLQIGEEMRN